MTDRETISEYKRVMNGVTMPAELSGRIIEKSSKAASLSGNSRYMQAVFALSGLAAVAAGIGAIALFNKKFSD